MRPLRKLMLIALALFVVTLSAAAFIYKTILAANTGLTHFDTIIVLGYPRQLRRAPHPPSSASAPSKASANTNPA